MRVSDWTRLLSTHPQFSEWAPHAARPTAWNQICEEARAPLIAALWHASEQSIFIITSSYEKCLKWQAKLTMCGVPPSSLHVLTEGTSALYEDSPPEHVALSDRLGSLQSIASGEMAIVISTPMAAMERTLPLEVLQDTLLEARPGDALDPDDLARRLRRIGYEPSEPVRLPGQFSKRGGILDVWPMGSDSPVRIEFFGDEVDSIRSFDAGSQRSTGKLPALSLVPSRETLFPEDAEAFCSILQSALDVEAARLDAESAARLEDTVKHDIESIRNRVFFDRLDLYRPMLHPDSGSAISLFPTEPLVVLDEPSEVETVAIRGHEELAMALSSRAERGEIFETPVNDFLISLDHLSHHRHLLALCRFDQLPDWLVVDESIDIHAESLEANRGRPGDLSVAIKDWKTKGFTTLFCTDQPVRAKSILSQIDVFVEDARESKPPAPEEAWQPRLWEVMGNLGGGFSLPDLKFTWVTDAELFGVARLRLPQKRFLEGAPVATVLDLKPGDFVVHIQFGIGVFRGLVKRTVEGIEKEFLYVEYQHPDKLFVPADQLDRIQKYMNPGEGAPKINRLTGSDWQKSIAKAKDDAKALAQDLVKLYAERKTVQRRPFGPDTPWQGEMEGTFPWVETPSQVLAIKEVKKDLEAPWPMDRLVCGDVGFGKTEIAIRAAFKVVQDGRQVAVLCPTTILSEQHFRNFSERMSSFGVRLALVNRFRTDAERKKTLVELKAGQIDVLIGTHALLSKEIVFKELGLVIIDEEQKFGVQQKEVLKKLRVEVDVLSLSATPIPRTLSMALMDLRQMSLINDPPPGRLPVRSYVRPYSKEVAREAILRELSRGGQVFYVYNRVQGIQHIAESLRKLVPNARIGVGHGQMSEAELEPVMIGFLEGEIDILLSTSIIENGIDISNANTLIVENADRFGLSQLYQLKGRVGRSDRQAYSYFLYQGGKDLTDGAFQRLQALQEFGQLGAGYSLAFRDLQIRGAGDLLGAKQSGTMAAIGYELYTQLIHEQIELLKNAVDGIPVELMSDSDLAATIVLPTFELPVEAFIPDTYIGDAAQRLYCYSQMMRVRDFESLTAVREEITDRYGIFPEPVAAAFHVLHLRIKAHLAGIDKVEAKGGRISAMVKGRTKLTPYAISMITRGNREAFFARDALIWPYSGDALEATDRMMETISHAIEEDQELRAGAEH